METIRRAKKEDSKGHLREAVHFYELGAGLLLDAVRRGQVSYIYSDLGGHGDLVMISYLKSHQVK